jgi:hypothetical protein
MRMDGNKPVVLLGVLLLSVAIYQVLHIYGASGISWDFISHYLNAEALIHPQFYSSVRLVGYSVIVYNHGLYFEIGRAPLSSVILALLLLVSKPLAIELFIVFTFVLLFIAAFYIANELEINPLLLEAFMFVPYVLSFIVLSDSEDVLSFALLGVALLLLFRKSELSGLALGLAGLAKYSALIFLPLIFLLASPKKVRNAALLCILVTAPWLVFNTYYFGLPMFSYVADMSSGISLASPSLFSINYFAILEVLSYPLVGIAMAALALLFKKTNAKKRPLMHTHGASIPGAPARRKYYYAAIMSFLSLSVIGFLIVGQGKDAITQMRYVSFLYLGVSVLSAFWMTNAYRSRNASIFGREIDLATLLSLAFFLGSLLMLVTFYGVPYVNAYAVLNGKGNSSLFANVTRVLGAYGLSNRTVVSNAWPYLLYRNISAYSTYYLNKTLMSYPLVLVSAGVGDYYIDMGNYTLLYNSSTFRIYAPR